MSGLSEDGSIEIIFHAKWDSSRYLTTARLVWLFDARCPLCVNELPMGEATRILSAIEAGDPAAAAQLLPLVYDELRKLAALRLAHEKPGQTLQATALVHEAFLKLVDGTQAQNWNSRGHFFAAAAEAMRRILVDNARRKRRPKAGGDLKRIDFDETRMPTSRRDDELLFLHAALEKLAQMARASRRDLDG